MLKVHALGPARWRYYVDDLVPGRAEDTAVAGESPGRWVGAASRPLGLTGRVEAAELAALLSGRSPSGVGLRTTRSGRSAGREVGGFDLTVGAPKSVSVLALLGPNDVGRHALAGHASAVEAAWGWLERTALGVRRQVDGRAERLPATGFVAAEFLHRTSRALDPHVHTHLVVANVAHGSDGRWSTLDSRRLYAHLPAAQALYHAQLRFELAHRLGVAWEASGRDRAEVVGVDPVLCGALSRRTAEIGAWLHEQGRPTSSRGRSVAAAVTRPDKDVTVTVEDLVEQWADQAELVGCAPRDLAHVVGRAMPPGAAPTPGSLDPDVLSERLAERAEEGPLVGRVELVVDLAASTPAGAPASAVAGWADDATRVLGGTSRSDGGADRWPLERVIRVVGDLADGRIVGTGRAVGEDQEPFLGRSLRRAGGAARGPGLARSRALGPELGW